MHIDFNDRSGIKGSVIWQKKVLNDIKMNSDIHNIALSFASDGFQPYRTSQSSVWPLILTVLNLPSQLRNNKQLLLLNGVPSPNAGSLQPFIKIMVHELNNLYTNGANIHCSACDKQHLIYVKLLFTVADYPAHSKINLQHQQGSEYGCHKCYIKVYIHTYI